MDSDRLLKLKVVAMVAVILEESSGDYLQTSPQRDPVVNGLLIIEELQRAVGAFPISSQSEARQGD